jgi:hypothetical protein
MQLDKSLILAILFSIAGLTIWELYWRFQGKVPDINDDKDLWAVQRAKLKNLDNNDFVLTGSSRVLFDIQLDEWEKETGKRPVMLASPGSSPLPVFRDIVENTDFAGTVIVGVTPGLFFSTTYPMAQPWKRAQSKVDHFHNRTYAQRLNHWLGMPMEKNLVFVSVSEEQWDDDIDLRSLLRRCRIGNRTENNAQPPFYSFSYISLDRNVRMTDRTATDTAFANSIKKVWAFFGKNAPPPDKESTMAYFLEDAAKFQARGGNLILLRCPSNGDLRAAENVFFPRSDYWDELLVQSKAKGYHFEDYVRLNQFECPEWSHLSAPDAEIFTQELTRILISDGAITYHKNQ